MIRDGKTSREVVSPLKKSELRELNRYRPAPRHGDAAIWAFLVIVLLRGPGWTQEDRSTSTGPVEVVKHWFPHRMSGMFRPGGGWIPVTLQLKSQSGKPETVRIEATVEGQEESIETVESRTVEVVPGAPRRAEIRFRIEPGVGGQLLRLRLSVRGTPIFAQEWRASAVNLFGGRRRSQQLSGMHAHPSTLVVARSVEQQLPWFSSAVTLPIDYCDPTDVPTDLLGLQCFDMIVLRSSDVALLPEQMEALTRWVFLGGHLVFAPPADGPGELVGTLFKRLLGSRYTDPKPRNERIIEDLVSLTRERVGEEPTLLDIGPQDKAETPRRRQRKITVWDPVRGELAREIRTLESPEILIELARGSWPESDRLYGELAYGSGSAGVLTFYDVAFRDSISGPLTLDPIWSQIISWHSSQAPWRPSIVTNSRLVNENYVDSLQDPEREIGFVFIAALVVSYLVLVGPGIWFLLRYCGRLPWVIWVQPAFVAVFLVVIGVVGYWSKGATTRVRAFTVISEDVGDPLAFRTTYVALFSGGKRSYQLRAPRGFLFSPFFANDEAARSGLQVRGGDGGRGAAGNARRRESRLDMEHHAQGGLELGSLHLDQWQEGYLINAGVEELLSEREASPGVLCSAVDENNENLSQRLRIENRLPYDIQNGAYFDPEAGGVVPVPALATGASVEVNRESQRLTMAEYANTLTENERRVFRLAGRPGRRRIFLGFLARNVEDLQGASVRERVDAYVLNE